MSSSQATAERRTYRGRTLEEIAGRIRSELGDDAVITRQREGLVGGIGGFFQRPFIEVEAQPGPSGEGDASDADEPAAAPQPEPTRGRLIDTYDDGDELPEFVPDMPFDPAELAAEGASASAIRELFEQASPFAGEDGVSMGPAMPSAFAPASPAAPAAAPAFFASASAAAPAAAAPAPAPAVNGAAAPAAAPAPAPAPAMNGAAAPGGPAIPPTATFARELEVAAHVRESFETAAAPSAALAVPGAGSAAPAVADGASRRPRMADLLEAGLREAGMSPELAAEVIGEAVSHGMPFASPRAIKRLARWALTRRLPASSVRAPGGLTMAFVGPSGSGKTLCTARLAVAYAHGSDLPVVCLSLRPRDGGAELADLVRPHGVQVQVVEETSEAFATALSAVAERALVVIDTPAINPRSAEDLDRLAGELRAIGLTETHLVLPATFSAAAAREQLGRLEPLGISRLAVTRTDETDHLGPVAELAIATGLPLSYVTSSDEVLGGMTPADPHQLAVRLLP